MVSLSVRRNSLPLDVALAAVLARIAPSLRQIKVTSVWSSITQSTGSKEYKYKLQVRSLGTFYGCI